MQILIYSQQEKIFQNFIAKFYTLKQKYSGIPENIENKDKFAELLDYIIKQFGIKINPSEIRSARNDGMRTVIKLILNSVGKILPKR